MIDIKKLMEYNIELFADELIKETKPSPLLKTIDKEAYDSGMKLHKIIKDRAAESHEKKIILATGIAKILSDQDDAND